MWPCSFNHLHMCTRAPNFLISFTHCRAASTVIHNLPTTNFSPSSNQTSVYLIPTLHLLLPSSTPFWLHGTHPLSPCTCLNHLNTVWSTLLENSLSIPALIQNSSYLHSCHSMLLYFSNIILISQTFTQSLSLVSAQ